jgi:hypothetical protein
MQNLISIIASNPKVINVSKDTKDGESSQPKKGSKDFVAILFDQIKNSVKLSTGKGVKTSQKTDDAIDILLKDDKKKSSSELLLNEVLSIISLIKGDDKNIQFPKFSDKLDKVLNNKTILNEFLNVKNIQDITKLSKKYDLGLENIKFTKEKIETLQKDFPKLDLKKFFEVKTDKSEIQSKIVEQPVKSKKTTIIEQMIKNLPNDKESSPKTSKNILQTLLKTIDKDTKKVIIKTNEEDKKNKVDQFVKKSVDVKSVDVKSVDKNPLESIKISSKEPIHTAAIAKHSKVDTSKTNDKKLVPEISVIDEKIDTKKTKEDTKAKVSNSKIKKDVFEIKQNVQNHISKDLNIQKKSTDTKSNTIQSFLANADQTDNSKKNTTEVKYDPAIHKDHMQTQTKLELPKTDKLSHPKESLNQFSTDLKEKIESYKPPLMKLQMALNPKNLGEVEVTLISRGNNLHVNITSNTNTMSLFTQNQAEFKNSLVNMGFTNLEMNFSDQGKGNQQNQNGKQNKNRSFENLQEQQNHENTVELIVPQYV